MQPQATACGCIEFFRPVRPTLLGMAPPRWIDLARTPTPLEHLPHLTRAWDGPQLWVKRDDLTGFELSGNKVRKLEFHLAAALDAGADTVITTGAIQSNHCRATALAACRLGLACTLVLRTHDGAPPTRPVGNHLLHRASGADIIYVDAAGYLRRDDTMADLAEAEARAGRVPWIIPEGASDALGMLGMAAGFAELAEQAAAHDLAAPTVWHASSSAGTTAGFGWAAARTGPDFPIVAVSVGDPAHQLEAKVAGLWADGVEAYGGALPEPDIELRDDYVAEGYGLVDPAQPGVVAEATRLTGLLFDPTYTGKALFGLQQEIRSGRFGPDDHVIFWHTGGGFEALVA